MVANQQTPESTPRPVHAIEPCPACGGPQHVIVTVLSQRSTREPTCLSCDTRRFRHPAHR
jgi:transposase